MSREILIVPILEGFEIGAYPGQVAESEAWIIFIYKNISTLVTLVKSLSQ